MRYIITSMKAACFLVVALTLLGCSEEGIIQRDTMVSIIEEMYLADQYIEQNPDMRAQTDSMSVYPAIMAKYGYSMADYENSIRYWLQEDGEYNEMLKQVQDIMEAKMKEIDARIMEEERLRMGPAKWWALDSVRNVAPQEFLYDHLLRGVRWLVVPAEKLPGWKMLDSAVVDIPQNPQWWSNNMTVPQREFSSFFVRGEADGQEDAQADDKAKEENGKPKNLKPFTKTDLVITEEPGEEEEERIQNAF